MAETCPSPEPDVVAAPQNIRRIQDDASRTFKSLKAFKPSVTSRLDQVGSSVPYIRNSASHTMIDADILIADAERWEFERKQISSGSFCAFLCVVQRSFVPWYTPSFTHDPNTSVDKCCMTPINKQYQQVAHTACNASSHY